MTPQVRLKCLLLTLIILGSSHSSFAQTPSWVWAKGVDSLATSAISVSVATDNDGYVAIGGYYYDKISIGGTELPSVGKDRANFFLALYDKTGVLQWAKKVGDVLPSHGNILKVVIDSNRNVFAFGYYQDSIIFNDIEEHSPNFTSIFGVGFDKNGSRLWVNTLAKNVKPYDNNHQSTYQFASGEINGTIYIAGSFDDSLIAPSTTHSKPFILTKSGVNNFFLASFDQLVQLGSIATFEGSGIVSALCGHSTGTTTTDVFIGATQSSGSRLLVAEIKNDGQILWTDTASSGYGLIGDIAFNQSKNSLFIAGSFGTSLTFGNHSLAAHSSFFDGFVLKLSDKGEFKWLQQIGGDRVDQCFGVSFDNDDNAYAIGYFQQSAKFGTTTLSNPSDARANIVFIAKYDLDGTPVWAMRPTAGDNSSSVGNAIAVKALRDGRIFANITGSYFSECQFGNTPPLNGNGFFLASLLLNGSTNVVASHSEHITIKAYPNPVTTEATLEFLTDETSVVEINISDALGRNILQSKLPLVMGSQSVRLDVSKLQEGIYCCAITCGAKYIGSSKLIVR